MAGHVNLRLFSVGAAPDAPNRSRTIRLTNNQTMPVGRASKVESKGYIAGVDNCWYDSAVMSRKHAEFSADILDKSVSLTDQGSLHGTYVNNDRILANQPQVIQDGDTIDFGLPIIRNHEEFPPTRVRVNFDFAGPVPEPPRVFRAPVSEDGEDLSDDDISVQEITQAPPENYDLEGMRAYAARNTLQQLADITAVDLTGEDVMHAEGPVVDLTGSQYEMSAIGDASQGLSMAYSPPDDSDAMSEHDDLSQFDSDEGEEEEVMERLSSISTDSDEEDRNDDEFDEEDEDMDSDLRDWDGPQLPDDDTGFWDDPDSDADIPSDLDDFDATSVRELVTPPPALAECSFPVPPLAPLEMPEINQVCSIPALLNPTAVADRYAGLSYPRADGSVAFGQTRGFISSPMADLGARTGKSEFFEARAANKLTLQNAATAAVETTSSENKENEQDTEILNPELVQHDLLQVDPAYTNELQKISAAEKPEQAAAATPPAEENAPSSNVSEAQVGVLISTEILKSGEKFLNSPPADHKLDDERLSEGDDEGMVSAATFQEHKLAKLEKEMETSSRKRKADKMSEEEAIVEPLTPTSEKETELPEVAEPPTKRPATEAAVAEAQVRRQSRAWAVVEKMGLAALGGAVVFGALVSSAPAL